MGGGQRSDGPRVGGSGGCGKPRHLSSSSSGTEGPHRYSDENSRPAGQTPPSTAGSPPTTTAASANPSSSSEEDECRSDGGGAAAAAARCVAKRTSARRSRSRSSGCGPPSASHSAAAYAAIESCWAARPEVADGSSSFRLASQATISVWNSRQVAAGAGGTFAEGGAGGTRTKEEEEAGAAGAAAGGSGGKVTGAGVRSWRFVTASVSSAARRLRFLGFLILDAGLGNMRRASRAGTGRHPQGPPTARLCAADFITPPIGLFP